MFLQSLPTQDWGDHEIEMLLSEAFVLNSIWHNAQSHFTGKSGILHPKSPRTPADLRSFKG